MVKRVNFPYAPSGTIDNHQRMMLGVGLDEVSSSVETYMICSSEDPDVLDLYVEGVLVERDTSGLVSESNNDNTYLTFNGGVVQKYIDGVLVEETTMTNIEKNGSSLDFLDGITLVERITSV